MRHLSIIFNYLWQSAVLCKQKALFKPKKKKSFEPVLTKPT